jgi:hypothetical protein
MTTAAPPAKARTLNQRESDTLGELENVISDGLRSFVQVGEALLRIRDEKLYRATHRTFEAYCRERWDLSRSRAYQLLDAYAVSTIVDIQSEAVARELAPFKDDPDALLQIEAVIFRGEQATSEGWQKVTAEQAARAAWQYRASLKPKRDPKQAREQTEREQEEVRHRVEEVEKERAGWEAREVAKEQQTNIWARRAKAEGTPAGGAARKVEALIAKALDGATPDPEAHACIGKARQLVAKHNLIHELIFAPA